MDQADKPARSMFLALLDTPSICTNAQYMGQSCSTPRSGCEHRMVLTSRGDERQTKPNDAAREVYSNDPIFRPAKGDLAAQRYFAVVPNTAFSASVLEACIVMRPITQLVS